MREAARALYGGAPPEAALSAFGLSAAMFEEDDVEVWQHNWQAFSVFEAMSTQWRTGMAGASGLDYAALPAVMRLVGVPKKDRDQVFHDVRIMEAEALAVMAEQKAE